MKGFQYNLETIKGNYGEQMIYQRLKAPGLFYSVRLDPEPIASNFDLLFQDGKEEPLQLEVKVCEVMPSQYTGINKSCEEDYKKIKEEVLLMFIDKSTKTIYGNYFRHLNGFGIDIEGDTGKKVIYPVSEMKPIDNFIEGFNSIIEDNEIEVFERFIKIKMQKQEPPLFSWELKELLTDNQVNQNVKEQ